MQMHSATQQNWENSSFAIFSINKTAFILKKLFVILKAVCQQFNDMQFWFKLKRKGSE